MNAIQKLISVILGTLLLQFGVTSYTNQVLNLTSMKSLVDLQDKAIAKIELKEQRVDVLTSWDYLFMNMRSTASKVNIMYNSNTSIRIKNKRSTNQPIQMYEKILKSPAFNNASVANYHTDGLELSYYSYYYRDPAYVLDQEERGVNFK